MNEELIIEGISFDLGESTIFQTFQVNDLADLKDRRANVSNTIRAPYTPKNIAALNFLGIAGSQSRAPYERLKAKHVINGIEIVSNGYAKIRAVNDAIEIVVYSGNIDLMERVKGRNINDLDFSDLNHFLNLSTFENGLDNTEGYVYALADFGISPPRASGLMQAEWQVPSVFFHTIWKKIFEQAGITYSGEVFEDESYLTEVLAPAKGYEVEDIQEIGTLLGTITSNQITVSETSNTQTDYSFLFDLMPSGVLSNITLIESKFIRSDFSGVMKITVETQYYRNAGELRMLIIKNGSGVKTQVLTNSSGSQTTEITILARENDIFSFRIIGTSTQSDPYLPIFKSEFGADVTIDVEEINGGLFIDFNEIMPKLSQEQFIKDVMQRYGLVFRSFGNHYEFKKYEEILNDRENAEDWSDKLKIEQGEDYEFGNFARHNRLLYKYTDEEKDFAQDGVIIVDNEHGEYEKEMFTSAFTISEAAGISISRQLYNVPIWEGKFNDETGDLEEAKIKEIQPRIFKIQRIPGNISVKFFDSQPLAISTDIPFLSLEDVQMDFYVANYYKAFNRILNAPKVIKDIFYLNAIDIQNLDFFKLKYLRQRGQYYYLNKVESYRQGTLTKCELVQVNGISKGVIEGNQPPQQLGVKEFTTQKGASFYLSLSDFVNTVPPYFDPEYDAPEKLKIISFGNDYTRLLNNDMVISEDTIVDANNFNLKVKDYGKTNTFHSATFEFKIQSFNNPNFSSATGKIVVNVLEYVNRAPVADAGVDILIQQEPGIHGNHYEYEIELNGCNSYDPDGDPITFFWEFIDGPAGVELSDDDICNPTLDIDINNAPDLVRFQIRLTVTDPEGLTDSDILNVTLTTYTNTNG